MAFKDWMAQYQDKTLGEIHMPGAHDAGTMRDKVDIVGMGASISNSVTQDLSIRDQLRAGTRFFDLRLKVHGEKVVAHHTTAGVGAYGKKGFDQTIAEVDRWCRRHPTEVVILRISHTKADTNVANVIINSVAQNGVRGGALHNGTGNLCTKKLRDIVQSGGGLICILDEKVFGKYCLQTNGLHCFSKYKSSGPNSRGIACCGIYKGTNSLGKVITNGLKGSYEHNKYHSHGDHLWQVYWQKTYTNPFHGTGINDGTKKRAGIKWGKVSGGTHAATGHMIKLMQGHVGGVGHYTGEDYKLGKYDGNKVTWSTGGLRQYLLPNIISYDFVNETTNAQIIALNQPNRQQHLDEEESEMESAIE